MSETTLSFSASASFRNNLMGRNLPPYNVPGSYSPPSGDVNYEATPLSDSSVIDSPNDLIGTPVQANELYSLNEWGPEGGYSNIVSTDGPPLPVNPNQGEYGQDDAQIDLINEFFIDVAYLKNIYGPSDGYKNLITITDIVQNSQFFLPYSNDFGSPIVFNPSVYTPIQILLEDNPQGSNGLLSQDSELARRGALALKEEFQKRIEFETQQLVSSVFQLDQLQDPFEASLVATGQQPLIGKNWKITVPENPILAAVSFANRLTGTYFPVSPIPGDYFDETTQFISPQTENALNTANNLTGGFLGPILNKYRNPSEIFLANTGYGQRSVLFKSLEYNIYRPTYNKGLILGATSAISNALGLGEPNGGGGYYVGSDQAEPSTINSPANEVPVDRFGKQQPSPVYGPSDLAKLYEGNDDKIKFGLGGKSYSNQGGIAGQFVWTSPKYKDNLGFKVKPGGDPVQPQDQEFDAVKNEFNQDTQSSDFEFKGGSILDNTQRLIESADNVTGTRRLQHVGNAINQVSKVFNDGYKEMTKGSQVIAYYDSVTGDEVITIDGTEVGKEYCRVFQKDTPYLTYGDLQKTDGITTAGRKFSYSVFDNTYNLNIAPLRNPGSTNIIDGKVKKYMFSIENLAWRTSSEPGFTYDDLPACEKGPNGGRIMWFPPYNLTFSDSSTAGWNPTSFLGRPEPIYTYKNTTRSGQLGWTIVVDSPAMMNTIVEKQLENIPPEQVDSIMDSFFAGCVKYDLYNLALKFNTIPVEQLRTFQEILQNKNASPEEKKSVTDQIGNSQVSYQYVGQSKVGVDGKNGEITEDSTGNNTKIESLDTLLSDAKKFIDYGFYFDNNYPTGENTNVTTDPDDYSKWYKQYIGVRESKYNTNLPPPKVEVGENGPTFTKEGINTFYDKIIIKNFELIEKDFLQVKIKKLLDAGATVTIDLVGSASAPAKATYNKNLSSRRLSTVLNWLKKQTINDRKVEKWIEEKRIIFNTTSAGEEISVTKTNDGDTLTAESVIEASVNCTKDIRDFATKKVTDQSQWYSIPAMACRRVAIKNITATITNPPKWGCKDNKCQIVDGGEYADEAACKASQKCKPTPQKLDWKCDSVSGCIDTKNGTGQYLSEQDCLSACTKTQIKYSCRSGKCERDVGGNFNTEQDCLTECGSANPEPVITTDPQIEKQIKESITKKILRSLFSECDYFEVIKETNPTVYASFKDKIKYFSPTFHSMTPEGLNARLTFLNQCVRPGQTIPVIGPDGNPKYNDARNTSFGAPPVLVLRIGDFYHTKIIPNQLSIQYEPLMYDINPEGIGIQPMLAKITLGFDFIGGHGLAGPVSQLQNALSFNFYANTEIYDERAVATESTNNEIFTKIESKTNNGSSNSAPILNQPAGDTGGATIGNILTTENFEDGTVQTGTTEFNSIFKDLSDKTNGYFTTMFNQIKSLNETTNYPITQLVLLDRRFNLGNLNDNEPDNSKVKVEIIGKSDKSEDNLFKLFNEALKDIDDKNNPIIKQIEDQASKWSAVTRRNVRNTLYSIVQEKQNEVSQAVIGSLNTITKYQEDYVQIFRKLDLVINKIDGYKLETGDFKVYELTNIVEDVIGKMKEVYPATISKELNAYYKDLTSNRIIDGETIKSKGEDFSPIKGNVFTPNDEYIRRFYMVMSDVFVNKDKYDAFVDKLLTDQVKGNSDLVVFIKQICEDLRTQYIIEYDEEKKIFTSFESTGTYQKYKNFKIDEFDTKLNYTTNKELILNYKDKQKLLKKTYSNLNVNNDRKTFNGKITFN